MSLSIRYTLLLAALAAPVLGAGIDPASPTDEGRALLRARTYHLAMEQFLQVQEKSGNAAERAQALKLIGETEFYEKDYDSAYHAYQQSLRINPLSTGAVGLEFKSAVALIYLKNYSAAVSKLQELEKRSFDLDSLCDLYFWESECHFQLGEFTQASEGYEKILSKNPRYKYADLSSYLRAWCSFQKKDYGTALDEFSKVWKGTQDPAVEKLSAFQVAESLFRLGRLKEAQAGYEKFLAKYKGDFLEAPALYGLAWSLEKQTDHPKAEKVFEKILTNFPNHPLAPWAAVREGAEANLLGDKDQARQAYERGLELAVHHAPADLLEYGLGWLDYEKGDYSSAAAHFKTVGDFLPQSELHFDAQYLQAGCLYLLGKYEEAEGKYKALAAQAPVGLSPSSAYWQAWCEYALNKFGDAKGLFKDAADHAEGDLKSRALWAMGESAFEGQEYPEAVKAYQSALSESPSQQTAQASQSGIGWSYFQLENFQDAAEAFQKAVQLDPSSPLAVEAQMRSGDCYYNLHDYLKAEDSYNKVTAQKPGPPYQWDAQEQLGWCAYREEKFDDAVKIWDALMGEDETADRKSRLLYWSAWAHFRSKDFTDAAVDFQKVEDLFPKDSLAPESHLRRADCFFNLKDFKKAKETYQSFLAQYPSHPLLPDALYGVQWSAEKLGDKDESNRIAEEFLTKFPDSPFASGIQYRMAENLFHDEKFPESIAAFQALLKSYPDSAEAPRALFWLGTALVKNGQSKEAVPVFQDLLTRFPSDPLALEGKFSVASLDFESGKFQDALNGYEEIFTDYPDHRLAPHALFNSAVCEKQLGHMDKSLEYFQKLMKDYGNDPVALEAGIQAGILLEKTGKKDEALEAYALTMKCPDRELAVEASYYHADLLRSMKKYDLAIHEFNALTLNFPKEDQWVVTSFAQIAECYEEQKQFEKAKEMYERILKYTQVKAYRNAALKRLKALEPFLKPSPSAKPKKKSTRQAPKKGAKHD